MSRIYEFPPPDDRSASASAWIAKLDRGLTEEETQEPAAWIARHPDNRALLLELAGLWDRMDSLSRLADLFQTPPRRTRKPALRFAAVAAVLCAGLLGWRVLVERDVPVEPAASRQAAVVTPERLFETAIGEQSTVNLTDGSQIVLNTNSLVRVEYTRQHRLVTLERGEILVRVAEDRNRPLSVVAGDKVIQAVGTEFSVDMADTRRIELIVTKGRVLVGAYRAPPIDAARREPAVLPLSSVTVGAGEELILGAGVGKVTEISPVELEVKLSWEAGNLIFRGESLEEALKEIGRYTSVEFVIADDELKHQAIAGLFKAGDIDGLLAALRANFDIAYQRTDDRIILLSSRPTGP